MGYKIVVGVSNRHVHLTQEHVEILFGEGHQLTNIKDLGQPGQYACEETVTVVGPKNNMERVRILGPTRPESQVEISFTDARMSGIKADMKDSGNLEGTPGCTLIGPCGTVELERGVIVAGRHAHFSIEDAKEAGVVDKERVQLKFDGPRALIFEDVLCRVSEKFAAEVHIDTDEGNAAMAYNGQLCEVIKYEK